MMNVLRKYFGHSQNKQTIDKGDDFANFFYNAKSAEKKKLMKRVMQRATKDQLEVINKAKAI